MTEAKFVLFPAHHYGIKDREIYAEQKGRDPGACCDGNAQRKHGASQIERIASVGVRARDGEHFLFVKIARGPGTQSQTDQADQRTVQNAARIRPRKE